MKKEFDAYNCPLTGNNLVEAGAGTGKTYNLQILVARLILAGLKMDEILVVTFTRNATAELRERLRNILSDLQNFISGRTEAVHDTARAAKLLSRLPDTAQAHKRIDDALRDFDTAAIFTIHGFCQRMLAENAFESGTPYGMTLNENSDAIVKSAANDFIRKEFFAPGRGTPQTLALRQWAWFSTDVNSELFSKCKKLAGDHSAKSFGIPAPSDAIDQSAALYYTQYQALLARLSPYFEVDLSLPETPGEGQWLERLFATKTALDHIRETLLSQKGDLRKNIALKNCPYTVKVQELPKPLDGLCSADQLLLKSEISQFHHAVLNAAGDYLRKALQTAREEHSFFTFDDLLTSMRDALAGNSGAALRTAIRHRYHAALVDEFQDTDQTQYEIFNDLFGQSPEHLLFMIGDPKQAIYSFRGGDIYTYCNARAQAGVHTYTLTTNYRSSANCVEAMNRYFAAGENGRGYFNPVPDSSLNGNASALPVIDFETINSCDNGAIPPMELGFTPPVAWPALSCHIVNSADNALKACVAEIRAMLRHRDKICLYRKDSKCHTPLRASDIAVLVRSNSTGEKLEEMLLAAGINCIGVARQPLFARPEAAALLVILRAINEPRRRECFMNMLSLPAFALEPDELRRCQDGGVAGEFQLALLDLRKRWEQQSFLAMYRQFMGLTRTRLLGQTLCPPVQQHKNMKIVAQLLNGVPNQSEISIWKQLGEALDYIAGERRLSPTELTAFLERQIDSCASSGSGGSADSAMPEDETMDTLTKLRMRTQDDAVSIMTIHGSKGLQFPFVFLPDLRDQPNSRTPRGDFYHDADGRRRMLTDSNAAPAAITAAQNESFAETRRLTYVAITRAELLCRIVTVKDAICGETEEIEWLPGLAADAGNETPLSTAVMPEMAAYHPFSAPCPQGWQTCSYSSLSRISPTGAPADSATAAGEAENTGNDDDALPPAILTGETPAAEAAVSVTPPPPIFRFPRGIEAGLLWHRIFEQLDYQQNDMTQLREWTANQLDNGRQLPPPGHPLREEMLTAFVDMIRGVKEQPLFASGQPLNTIAPSRRRHEMDFKFQIAHGDGLHTAQLRHTLTDAGIDVPENWFADDDEPLKFRDFALSGQIDLLYEDGGQFRIVDWKTNILAPFGERPNLEFFNPRSPLCRMREEMDAHFYTLQYLLYTVTFMKWYAGLHPGFHWTEEQYDRLFGGCCYVFLRGVSHQRPGYGLFETKPQWQLAAGTYRIFEGSKSP